MRDYDIRRLLKSNCLFDSFSDDNLLVIDELDIASAGARIDVAVVNGKLHGYEIKGANDTLNRLSYQIEAYKKIFDYVTVVTEQNHYEKVKKIIPSWIGISLVHKSKNGVIKIIQKKKPKFNPDKQSFFLAKLLWKEELVSILNCLNIPHKKNERNWLLCELLANSLDVEEISLLVREKLKKRQNWKTNWAKEEITT